MSRKAPGVLLGDLWEIAEWRARAQGRAVLVSASEASETLDPIALFARRPAGASFLWYVPRTGEALVGFGCQRLPTPPGVDPALPGPERVARAWRFWASETLTEGPLPPLAFAGWAFAPDETRDDTWWEPFGSAQLLLPRLLYRQQGDLAFRAVQLLARPGETPPPYRPDWPVATPTAVSARSPLSLERRDLVTAADWRGMLAAALDAIARGELAKVVLARSVELSAHRPFSLERALRTLAERYPTCTVFALALGEQVFLGATPERLAAVTGGTVTTVALAGSIPRQPDPATDTLLLARLRASSKDHREHRFVVEAIRSALEPLCRRLTVADEPVVLTMPNVYHLATPITGILADGSGVLDVAARLHPTPAVAGTPREAALAFIRTYEPVWRGWYAGALGWVEASGDGELVVALRSGILHRTRARIAAGCGIVADSDPESEWEEAEAKLRPMLEALTGA